MQKQNICVDDEEPPDGGLGCVPLVGNYEKGMNLPCPEALRGQSAAMNIPKRFGVSEFCVSTRATEFRRRVFKDVSSIEWNDWHWQIRHRITTLGQLESILRLSDDECSALKGDGSVFPLAITPYYASLLDPDNFLQPLRRTVIPVMAEKIRSQGEFEDPLGEDIDSPVPSVVHRYPDRVLFLVTDFCSTYCRYCTRSRLVGKPVNRSRKMERWNKAIA